MRQVACFLPACDFCITVPEFGTCSCLSSSEIELKELDVQAAINGFEITFTAPTRTFASEAEVHSKAVFKFLLDLSNVHHRFKSITHLVEYPDTQEAGPTVTNAMRVCSSITVFSSSRAVVLTRGAPNLQE